MRLTVRCHLHFRQNDQDLLRVTAGMRGWNRFQNKSRHRELTLEKKILPQLLWDLSAGLSPLSCHCSPTLMVELVTALDGRRQMVQKAVLASFTNCQCLHNWVLMTKLTSGTRAVQVRTEKISTENTLHHLPAMIHSLLMEAVMG